MNILHPPYISPVLKQQWRQHCNRFCNNDALIENAFERLEAEYEALSRQYHNMGHIANMLSLLDVCRQEIEQTEVLFFTIWYHDAVYNTLKQNNEEKSAKLAEKELQKMGLPGEMISKVCEYILATKAHAPTTESDLQFLLDFDLHVLGAAPGIYTMYTQAIRAEYSWYPDFIYSKGRKKVLQHFLNKPFIYQTLHFRHLYEEQARNNLQQELLTL